MPGRDEEGAGLGPGVELHALGGDAAGARHEHHVAGRAHAIGVAEDLDLVGKQLDVVAVDLDVLAPAGNGLPLTGRTYRCDVPLRLHPPGSARACARARQRAAASAARTRRRVRSMLSRIRGTPRNQRRISRVSHSRTGPIRKIEPATTTGRPSRTRARPPRSGRRSPGRCRPRAAAGAREFGRGHRRAASAPSCKRSTPPPARAPPASRAMALSCIAPNTSVTPCRCGIAQESGKRARAGRIVRGVE